MFSHGNKKKMRERERREGGDGKGGEGRERRKEEERRDIYHSIHKARFTEEYGQTSILMHFFLSLISYRKIKP